jgi:hypothetical protein
MIFPIIGSSTRFCLAPDDRYSNTIPGAIRHGARFRGTTELLKLITTGMSRLRLSAPERRLSLALTLQNMQSGERSTISCPFNFPARQLVASSLS